MTEYKPCHRSPLFGCNSALMKEPTDPECLACMLGWLGAQLALLVDLLAEMRIVVEEDFRTVFFLRPHGNNPLPR